jgi:serine/threonine protein kinase
LKIDPKHKNAAEYLEKSKKISVFGKGLFDLEKAKNMLDFKTGSEEAKQEAVRKESEDLKRWLQEIGLQAYFNKMEEEGYDDLEVIKQNSQENLNRMFKIIEMRPGHQDKFVHHLSRKSITGETALISDKIEIQKKLGEGTFGFVYLGRWGQTEVALKELKKVSMTKEIDHELLLLKNVKPHPNITTFFGSFRENNRNFLVFEYVSHGDLRTFLSC